MLRRWRRCLLGLLIPSGSRLLFTARARVALLVCVEGFLVIGVCGGR